MRLLGQEPTPREVLVERVLMHRWAERDGTYDELVAQRSQALAMFPGRAGRRLSGGGNSSHRPGEYAGRMGSDRGAALGQCRAGGVQK